ncbi:hypothetical protein KAK06_23940 [Ideonella sp. 4Y11]|uniref:Uncharacterized protein n=1 Tax=Ideonella aquatica TaxID=2824119 RepID=A0A941BNI0_9BURK|nr:hypothetical protein [Ideonella aquatica]MBQ0962009.1 hypothetical protein [Ideonella aquatica]
MPSTHKSVTLPAVVKAVFLGLAVLLLSTIVSFLTRTGGIRVNTEAWPPSARTILLERPGQPITIEQWRRIDKELSSHKGSANPSHLLAGEVRHSWFVFFGLAIAALCFVRRLRPLPPVFAGILLSAPNGLALLAAFAHTHPYYS